MVGPITYSYNRLYYSLLRIIPDIATDPDDVIATIGTTVILTCNATGADNLTYQWIRMGSGNIDTGVSTKTLTIDNVSIDDSGKYRCIVSSDGATVTSGCGALTILGELYILSYLAS